MADSHQTHDDRPTAQRSLFQTPTNPSTHNPSGNTSSTNTVTVGTDPVQFTDTGDSPSAPHGSSPVATDESSNVGSSTSNDESNTIAQLRAKIQELNDAVLKMSGQISPAMAARHSPCNWHIPGNIGQDRSNTQFTLAKMPSSLPNAHTSNA